MELSSFQNYLKNCKTLDNIQNNNHAYLIMLHRSVWFLADPTVFSGHTSGIRHAIFFRGDTHLVTCADDRTLRVWDRASGQVCTCYYCETDVGVNPDALWIYYLCLTFVKVFLKCYTATVNAGNTCIVYPWFNILIGWKGYVILLNAHEIMSVSNQNYFK